MNTTELATRALARADDVDHWFGQRAADLVLPPYCSVDLRDAGFKVAPVDCNLFPAGYNNLAEHYFQAATAAWRAQLNSIAPDTATVCVIPESHTRNTFYLQNVTNIVQLLEDAGYAVVVGTVDPVFVNDVTRLEAADGTPLAIHKARREGDVLVVDGAAPDLLLLNNDLADGWPDALRGLAQRVLPPPELGWHARHKSGHFAHYTRLAAEWSACVDVDPWFVTPETTCVEGVDFHEPDTFGPLADAVDALIANMQRRYSEYGINTPARCFIKDDAGTYGMGILVVGSGDEVRGLNRKQRNKMDRGKANAIISRVLIQEAVPTTSSVNGATAEPVLYAVGDTVVGGFMRYHQRRGVEENLNARGAQFTDLCPAGREDCFDTDPVFRLYQSLTRISILAAAEEISEVLSRSQADASEISE